MKMLNKTAAVLAVNEDIGRSCDPDTKYVLDELDALNYNIQKVTILSNNDATIAFEIENCIKQCDIVVLIGGIGGPYSDIICQILSKVFHQKLVFNERLTELLSLPTNKCNVNIPMYSKVLECSTNINSSITASPAVYVQGLLLLIHDFELMKLSFTNVVAPFLRDFNRKSKFKRILTLKFEQNIMRRIPRRDNVDVSYRVVDTNMKMTLTSTNMLSLYYYEEELKQALGSTLRCEEDSDIADLVYKQIDYSHIRSSIECIEECFLKYGPENVFISFNGGKDCTVLLHLTLGVLKKNYPNHQERLFSTYVENSFPFPELNSFIEQCEWYYNLNVMKLTKNIKESLAFVLKTKPHMKACLMGTRRTDPFSENLRSFQATDPGWPEVMRVSPLLEWHYSEIWDYLLHLKVPYCSLYDIGYTSLGNQNNSISNPALSLYDPLKDCKIYLPAYKLLDASTERNGRKQT